MLSHEQVKQEILKLLRENKCKFAVDIKGLNIDIVKNESTTLNS